MTVVRLYRGVSQAMHDEGRGLRPRGTQVAYVFKWGESGMKWGSGVKYGETETNGVFKHQQAQRSFPTSAWVSTTPHFEIAKKYALHDSDTGIVYAIDISLLEQHGVKLFRVAEVVNQVDALGSAEDDEHALVGTPPGELPRAIVVDLIGVKRLPDNS